MLFSTIHIAHVESAHARVEQRHGESAGRWGVQMDRAATLWSWSRRVAVAEAVDLAVMASEMMAATAPAAMEVVASGRRWRASGGGRWRWRRQSPGRSGPCRTASPPRWSRRGDDLPHSGRGRPPPSIGAATVWACGRWRGLAETTLSYLRTGSGHTFEPALVF